MPPPLKNFEGGSGPGAPYVVGAYVLHILATLPVHGASAERSFSALCRLETWMRSQMNEERLTGLAFLHTDRDIDMAKVIQWFATKDSGQRRLEFVI